MAGPGRKFKKGEVHNPGGRPKKDPIVAKFQEMTYKEFIERLQKFGRSKKKDIKKVIDDPNSELFDLIYCRHLYDALNGNDKARESLYNRLWGKVKDQIEHLGVDRSQIIVTLPDNGRSDIGKIDIG